MAEQATAEKETAKEEALGNSILTTKESPAPDPAKELFKSEAEKANAVTVAKEAALKELAAKEVADKAVADAAAAEVAKKAEAEKTKPTGKDSTTTDKESTTSQTEYTLNLPENSALTKEDLDATLKEAKANGLSEDKAKELLQAKDQVAKTAQDRLQQKQQQDLKNMVVGWREEVKKDPELGGEHLAETAIKASRAFKAVASPEMQLFCEKTGYADHPEMVRMMIKVYDLIGEDKFIKGSTGIRSSTPTSTEEKAKRLFGNPIKETA